MPDMKQNTRLSKISMTECLLVTDHLYLDFLRRLLAACEHRNTPDIALLAEACRH